MALSAYLQCCQPPTCPWDHCRCFYSPVPPCAADPNLLGRCLCGSFCIAVTCVDFPQPPKLTLCVAGLVCTCLSSQGPPSLSWGFCALVSSHWPAHFVTGPSVLLSAPQAHLCATWVVCTAQVCVPPLPGHPACPLGCKCCVRSRGLYATPHSASRARPLCHMGCVH